MVAEVGTSYADFAYHNEKGSLPLLELCFIDRGWAILTLEDVVICPVSKVRKDFDKARRTNFRTLYADSKSKKGNPPPIGITACDEQIEVRNICTGTLIQMMGGVGTNLRCIWSNPLRPEDGSGIVCVSDDSDHTRMFEIQVIVEPPAVQLSAVSGSEGSSGIQLFAGTWAT